MKTLNFTLAFLSLSLGSLTYASGQSSKGVRVLRDTVPEETTVIVVGDVAKGDEGIVKFRARNYFRHNMERGFQQSSMPRFLITDKKANAVFAIGGFVEFRTAYDFSGKVGAQDFVTYNVPMSFDPATREGLSMDASTSRIYFKTLINTRPLGPIEAYIETDFRGGGNVLRLREAYVRFMGFTLGQTTSTFTDLQASPNTIDFEGPNAYTYHRNLMIQYKLKLGKGWSMAAAVEYPALNATYGEWATELPQRVPDIPLYFQYAWGKNGTSHVRASGLFRAMNYYDESGQSTEYRYGWGAQLSAVVTPTKWLQFYGQALYGEGIGSYVNDLMGNGFDMMPDQARPSSMSTPKVWAWLAGAQFNVTSKLPISVGYSQVHVFNTNNSVTPNQYKLSQYVVANAMYNINRFLTVGVEYLYGTRYNADESFGTASRAQAMIQLTF